MDYQYDDQEHRAEERRKDWARQQRRTSYKLRSDIAGAIAEYGSNCRADEISSNQRPHTPSIEYQLLRGFELEAKAAAEERQRQHQQHQQHQQSHPLPPQQHPQSENGAARAAPVVSTDRWSVLRALSEVEEIYKKVQEQREADPLGTLLREADEPQHQQHPQQQQVASSLRARADEREHERWAARRRRRRAPRMLAERRRMEDVEGQVRVDSSGRTATVSGSQGSSLVAVPHSMAATAIARKPFGIKRMPDSQYREAIRKAALAGFKDLRREHSSPKLIERVQRQLPPAGSMRNSFSLPALPGVTTAGRMANATPPGNMNIYSAYRPPTPPPPARLPYEEEYEFGSLFARNASDSRPR